MFVFLILYCLCGTEYKREVLEDESLPYFGLEHFLDMRRNPAAFEVILDHFVAPVIGMREFRKRIAAFDSYDALFTACDEAFIYLVLENNYARWMDMFKRSAQAAREGGRLGKSPWEFKSSVKTKYTEGGQQRPVDQPLVGGAWQQSKGWSDAGIERYNELFGLVKENRVTYKQTIEEWFSRKKVEAAARNKKRVVADTMDAIICETDLFDAQEEDGETQDDEGDIGSLA